MKFSTVFFGAAALAISTLALPAGTTTSAADGINCYGEPDARSVVVTQYTKQEAVSGDCHTVATFGNSTWWKTLDECFVPSGTVTLDPESVPAMDQCENVDIILDTRAAIKIFKPKNDYPYKGKCGGAGGVDKWSFFRCYCTSFAAFRVTGRTKLKFKNIYKGVRFGDAKNWDDAAKKVGIKVSSTPRANTVAVRNAGAAGHVAWVYKIDSKSLYVEEYNWNNKKAYGKRKIARKGSGFKFLYV